MQEIIKQCFNENLHSFFFIQQEDFKIFLLKHYDTWALQLDSIMVANHIELKKDLESLQNTYKNQIEQERLQYEQELEQKRKQWQESLENPLSVKHNIYKAI